MIDGLRLQNLGEKKNYRMGSRVLKNGLEMGKIEVNAGSVSHAEPLGKGSRFPSSRCPPTDTGYPLEGY